MAAVKSPFRIVDTQEEADKYLNAILQMTKLTLDGTMVWKEVSYDTTPHHNGVKSLPTNSAFQSDTEVGKAISVPEDMPAMLTDPKILAGSLFTFFFVAFLGIRTFQCDFKGVSYQLSGPDVKKPLSGHDQPVLLIVTPPSSEALVPHHVSQSPALEGLFRVVRNTLTKEEPDELDKAFATLFED